MNKSKKSKLNIFDYLVISVFLVITAYILFVYLSPSRVKRSLEQVEISVFCNDVPVKVAEVFKKGTKLSEGSERSAFGTVKEVVIRESEEEDKLFRLADVIIKISCKAKENKEGGYLINGTVFYTGQEARIFGNSATVSGCIYEIKEAD